MPSGPVVVVSSQVLAVQLEFEASDCFFTFRIVADNLHARSVSDVVLITVKNNLRDALSASKPNESANLVLKSELKISGWENQAWSENVDKSLSTEHRNLLGFAGPHVVVDRRKLCLNEVLNRQLCVFVVACKQHARR